MSEFSQWLTEQMAAKGRGGSLRAIAERTGAAHSTIDQWSKGKQSPSWHYCRGIADAFGVSRQYVRQLAGYVDPDEEKIVLFATLTRDERAIVEGYRLGDPQVQGALLSLAQLAQRLQTD